jgi:hypothetical protein
MLSVGIQLISKRQTWGQHTRVARDLTIEARSELTAEGRSAITAELQQSHEAEGGELVVGKAEDHFGGSSTSRPPGAREAIFFREHRGSSLQQVDFVGRRQARPIDDPGLKSIAMISSTGQLKAAVVVDSN